MLDPLKQHQITNKRYEFYFKVVAIYHVIQFGGVKNMVDTRIFFILLVREATHPRSLRGYSKS